MSNGRGPTQLISQNFGFRCVNLDASSPATAAARIEDTTWDYWKEKPVSDDIFNAFLEHYAYDKGELNARVEETETTENWTREKVSFDAAYGRERVIAHLFLPKNAARPLQTVVYVPGANAVVLDRFDPSWIEGDRGFVQKSLLKSGRAVLFPIYKGTFERRDDMKPGGSTGNPPALWRDHVIDWSKDLSRSLDYLETRNDIDNTKIAYFGFSTGGALAPVLLAVEARFKAAILSTTGFYSRPPLGEVDPFNFAPRVKIPVVMLTGQYDDLFPVESSQLPFFSLLGTPAKDKKHVIYKEAGHGGLPPREEVRESLDWLDKYLGPVRR